MGDAGRLQAGAGALLVTGLAVGALLGFGVGFAVLGNGGSEPEAVVHGAPTTESTTPASGPKADGASRGSTAARNELSSPRSALATEPPLTQSVPAGSNVPANPVETPDNQDRDPLGEALREAVEAKDLRRLSSAVHALGQSGSPGSGALLVELLADLEVPLAAESHVFANWLERSDARGVVNAARKRIEHHVARGEIDEYHLAGLYHLVARQGRSADLEWLVERNESPQIQEWAGRALRAAPRDVLEPFLAEHFVEDPWPPVLVELLRSLPLNVEWIAPYGEAVVRALVGGRAEPKRLPLALAMGRYAMALPEQRVPEAERFLRGLTDPWHRLAAAVAVHQLARQGYDISGLAEFHDSAAVWLRQECASPPARDAASERVRTVLQVIQSAGYTLWNEETAAALEFAAKHLRDGPTDEMTLLARRIRAHLASDWK